ncbi:MAG: RNA methyltransferase [Ardenticatenaceae bacterium]|nr:RNA methyltransferase [Ardenticatenaceae bacterium]
MLRITSLQNGRIKQIVKLNNRRQRDACQQTVVEGSREVSRALQHGLIPPEAYLCPDLLNDETAAAVTRLQQLAASGQTQLFEITPEIFAKIAYRGDSGGLLLVIPYLQQSLHNLPLSANPFFAIIENVEKPGNLGAILRTADAAGVDGVIVCSDGTASTDLHNPNVIRASLGTLFAVPVAAAKTSETIDWLRTRGIQIVVATPEAERLYTAVNLQTPVALVTGSEAFGLSPQWLDAAAAQVRIPMHGTADSLNLATATALLLYEVVRQRRSNGVIE